MIDLLGRPGAPKEGQGDPGESQGAPKEPWVPLPWLSTGSPGPPWVPLASLELHQTTLTTGLDPKGLLAAREIPKSPLSVCELLGSARSPVCRPLVKEVSWSSREARGTQGGPGGPREKPGGPQGTLGTPSLAFPWGPLALPGCPWPPWSSIKLT